MWTAEEVYPKPHKSIACNKICVMKLLGARRLLAGLTLLLLLPSPAPSPAPSLSGPELIGFSFSPSALAAGGPSAESTLAKLMARLHPDLVRLPVYWDAVAPASNAFDFSPVDGLLTTISDYNLHHRRSAHVLLVVGARNIAFPEVYLPNWLPLAAATDIRQAVAMPEYTAYLETTFQRYSSSPLLYGWQIENEPLDNVTAEADGDNSLAPATISDEMTLLRSIDDGHPVVVTTYNSAAVDLDEQAESPLSWLYEFLPLPQAVGHPSQALTLGDILGLDVYAVTDRTSLEDASAARRIAWKSETVAYWAIRAAQVGKPLWITEMQAAPWKDGASFGTSDLQASALAYRDRGAKVVLLWGVESWIDSPDWMAAGVTAVRTLRHQI